MCREWKEKHLFFPGAGHSSLLFLFSGYIIHSRVSSVATRNLFSLVVEAMIGTSFATPFLCCRKYANLSIQ